MDLICFSHIRWNFVYQRPQHLLNRFAVHNRVFIIEEPVLDAEETFYEIEKDKDHNLWIVVLHVHKHTHPDKRNLILKYLINTFLAKSSVISYMLWYYSPMSLKYSDHLNPALIIYDCMDELSAFKFAPPELKKLELDLMAKADIVFTGGNSLYEAKKHLHANIYSFPSSIDKAHFILARAGKKDPADQQAIPHPRFGFYGVIDERFDISLIDELSTVRPQWHFIFIGPVIKIDPQSLPKKENIHYLGAKTYDELPNYLSGWDVAILPFELNEATRFISPTKTPEYLAAGKPVISASITDVVYPYKKLGLVHTADTSTEFIQAAEEIFANNNTNEWLGRVDNYLSGISWNATWKTMSELIEKTLKSKTKGYSKTEKIYV